MNKKNITIVLLLAMLCNSCKRVSDSQAIINEFGIFDSSFKNYKFKSSFDTIRYNNKILTVFLEYGNRNNLLNLKSSLVNRFFGHYFIFNENGDLQTYYFLIDSSHSSSEVSKNNLQYKISERGSPFVDYLENETTDTIRKYTLLFSEFPRKNINAWVSYDGNQFETLSLRQSKIMPLLKETDIYTNSKVIFLKIEATKLFNDIKELERTRRTYDTINIFPVSIN